MKPIHFGLALSIGLPLDPQSSQAVVIPTTYVPPLAFPPHSSFIWMGLESRTIGRCAVIQCRADSVQQQPALYLVSRSHAAGKLGVQSAATTMENKP